MSKATIVPSIYGYLVCLASVIAFLIGVPLWVEATIDLTDPLHSERAPDIVSKSYDSWRVDFLRDWHNLLDDACDPPKKNLHDPPDDATLRSMYQAEKVTAIDKFSHRIRVSFIVRLVLVLIATILFIAHWRWLRRLAAGSASGTT